MTRRFRDLAISVKLWHIIGASVLGLFLAAGYSLVQLQRNLLAERKARAQSVVETALGILDQYGSEAAAGRLTEAEAKRTALRSLERIRYGTNEYFWVNDLDSRLLMHPIKPELVGPDLSELKDLRGKRFFMEFIEVVRRQGSGFVEYVWPRPGSAQAVSKIAFVKGFPRWSWVLGSGVYLDDLEDVMARETRRMLGATGALAALLALATALMARSVSAPLRRAVGIAHRLAQGDMTIRIEETAADEPGQLLAAMKEMIERHSRVLAEVRGAAAALSASSDRVSDIARAVFKGSSDQAAGAAQSNLSMQGMCTSIEGNRDTVRSTDRLAARAVREAAEGREAVLEAAGAVRQISEKILVIHEIAHQTTLLAHEFSIEETRAGGARASAEAGAQVRRIYEQTRSAAQEIGALAGRSAALVNKASRFLEGIAPTIEKTSLQVQTVSAAADEQTAHAKEITAAVARLDAISREHAAAAEKLSSEAADMRRRAGELQRLVAFFALDGPSAHGPALDALGASPQAPTAPNGEPATARAVAS